MSLLGVVLSAITALSRRIDTVTTGLWCGPVVGSSEGSVTPCRA